MTDVLVFDQTPPGDPTDPPDTGFICSECGYPLTYGGKGRKPKRCSASNGGNPDCYAKATTRATSKPRVSGNERLAEQATNILSALNGAIGMGALFTGFPGTAGAISQHSKSFEEQCYQALLLDPDMCRMIARGGSASGKIALAVAYFMFGMKVAPVALAEYREMKETNGTRTADARAA